MKRKSVATVEDFMCTAVISLKEGDELDSAQLEMQLADIRHLPVIDPKGHVVGVVSDRDILKNHALLSKPTPVAAIMSRRVRTVTPGTPAAEAAARMIEHKIGCLPVVGEDQQLIGIITETDFVRIAEEALQGGAFAR
ncbi:MAG: CBS domain-containing protein [Minicystis sp.]